MAINRLGYSQAFVIRRTFFFLNVIKLCCQKYLKKCKNLNQKQIKTFFGLIDKVKLVTISCIKLDTMFLTIIYFFVLMWIYLFSGGYPCFCLVPNKNKNNLLIKSSAWFLELFYLILKDCYCLCSVQFSPSLILSVLFFLIFIRMYLTQLSLFLHLRVLKMNCILEMFVCYNRQCLIF